MYLNFIFKTWYTFTVIKIISDVGFCFGVKNAVEKLKEIKKASINVLSLDQPVGEDEDTYLIDYVVDETSLNGGEFVNEIDKIEQENTVKLAMSKLKPRHQMILQQRLGLIDGEEKTAIKLIVESK